MASTIKVNTIQDAGGNTLLVSDGSGNITTNNIDRAFSFGTATGDGSTTTFDISQECPSANDLMVFVDNVRQEPGSGKSYTLGVDGSNLLKRVTFDAAPDASAEIYVINPHLSPEAVASAQNLDGLAFTSQTELAEVAADDDVLLIFDTSTSTVKKIQKSNIATTLSYVT